MPELKHYGIKGMRWGVRKSRSERVDARNKSKLEKAKARLASAKEQERVKQINAEAKRIKKGDTKSAGTQQKTNKTEPKHDEKLSKLIGSGKKTDTSKAKAKYLTDDELQRRNTRLKNEEIYKKRMAEKSVGLKVYKAAVAFSKSPAGKKVMTAMAKQGAEAYTKSQKKKGKTTDSAFVKSLLDGMSNVNAAKKPKSAEILKDLDKKKKG